jgi:hypothetical protein
MILVYDSLYLILLIILYSPKSNVDMKPEHYKALKGIFFPVKKVAAYNYLREGVKSLPHLNHLIIAETPTGPLIVNACSENYELISNEKLITPIVDGLEKHHDLKIKLTSFSHSKFYVDFAVQDKKMKVLEKDTILPRIRLNNSYDGSIRYSFEYGFYRVVCSNGLSVPEGDVVKENFMHTPSAGQAVEKTMKSIEQFIEDAQELVQGFKPLTKKNYSITEATQRMEEVAEEVGYPKKSVEDAVARLQVEMNSGFKVNDYLVYNAMNYALYNKPDSKMKTHKQDKVDHKILHYLIENPK